MATLPRTNIIISVRKPIFPIVEAFGYHWNANTKAAKDAATKRWCPFMDLECEKFRQYGFGYCSVTYAAAGDEGKSHTYAVCDHRLDGTPLAYVIADHFIDKPYRVVPEIVLTQPRTSFDYVAFAESDTNDIIAIETQAIDIRGGGVGPAWDAWTDGQVSRWRSYFTAEAARKGRWDDVAYGVNMANIYKRLGLQVAFKGSYLKGIGVPFYVLMQDRPFQYLLQRIGFSEAKANWDISFVRFEYTDKVLPDGRMEFEHVGTVRTTVEDYVHAMSADTRMAHAARTEFLKRVKRKAGLK